MMQFGQLRAAALVAMTFLACAGTDRVAPSAASTTPRQPPAASAAVTAFSYRPERVRVGSLYHYVKSNRDGSNPGQIYAYLASPTRLDVVKLEPHAKVSVNVIAELNWQTFSATRLDMWYDHPDGLHHRVFGMVDEGAELVMTVDDPRGFDAKLLEIIGTQPHAIAVPFHPVHVYGFELLTLAFALPHLVDPTADFVFGLVGDNPRFGARSPELLAYLGETWMRFAGEEVRHGVACRKYRVTGPWLGDLHGSIWVAHDPQQLVEIEIPLANNGEWREFALELKSVQEVRADEWQSWKQRVIAQHLHRAPAD
jgi:hypothetical protein